MRYFCIFFGLCVLAILLHACTAPMDPTITPSPTENSSVTIHFESNGGTSFDDVILDAGANALDLPIPFKEGYTFLGWYTDASLLSPFNSVLPSVTQLTLYANWQINQYTIHFEMGDTSQMDDISLPFGSVIHITDPQFEGLSFDGWFLDQDHMISFTDVTMPAHDITLYPRWKIQYVLTLAHLDGGVEIVSYHFPGVPLVAPDDPIRVDVVFAGWYQGIQAETPYTFDTMPFQNLYLIADWMTPGLQFDLLDDASGYEVSVGNATQYEHIYIPKQYQGKPVLKIADYGFRDAQMISIQLPYTLREIGRFAFLDNMYLETITLPWRIHTIGTSAFRGCHALFAIEIFGSSEYFESISGVLYSGDYKTLVRYPHQKARLEPHYILPDFVEVIAADAFSEVEFLSFTFGTGIQQIMTHAFYRMRGVSDLNMPDSVTSIELYAFREFASLKSITLGSGLTEISSYMFDSCVGLEQISLPFSIISIGYGAFYNCTSLQHIYILRSSIDTLISGALFMFAYTPSTMKINFIDQATVDAYKVAYHWSSYASKMQVNPS